MIIAPNATISIQRRVVRSDGTSGPGTIHANTPARIWSSQPALMKELYGTVAVYNLAVDIDVDLRDGDTVLGYNPEGLSPAPNYVVKRVITRDLGIRHRHAHMLSVGKGTGQ